MVESLSHSSQPLYPFADRGSLPPSPLPPPTHDPLAIDVSHLQSLPGSLFEHARLVTGIDLVLCHSCVVWAYRDKPPAAGDSIPACLSPLFRPAAASAVTAAAVAAKAATSAKLAKAAKAAKTAKAAKAAKAAKVLAGTQTLGSRTPGLENTAGVSKNSDNRRCGTESEAASRTTSGAADGAAGGAVGEANRQTTADEGGKADGADGAAGASRASRASRADRAEGAASRAGGSPGSAASRSSGPGSGPPGLSLTHRERKWIGLSNRVLPVSTLPSLATYGEERAKDESTTTMVTVAAVKALAAAAAAVAAAVEEGKEEEEEEEEPGSEGVTDAEAASPRSSTNTSASTTSTNRGRSWKGVRSPSTRKLLERDGARRTLVKAKLTLERDVSQQLAATGCAEHAGRDGHPERPERTGYARHAGDAECGAGAAAGGGGREHATLPPQPAAPSAPAAADAAASAAQVVPGNGTEEEAAAAAAAQPARARTHGLIYHASSPTSNDRSVARVAEERVSAGRSHAGVVGRGRRRCNREMLRPASPERLAEPGHERTTEEERCFRVEQSSGRGRGGETRVLRGTASAYGALGFGVVGLGVGFGIGVAVGAALMGGRR